MRAEPSLFAADVLLIADTGNVELGTPTVTTTLRGTGSVLMTVRTMAGPVHSGMYGGAAPDALAALISMLATLRDAEGRTTITGLDADGAWSGPPSPSNGSAPMRAPRRGLRARRVLGRRCAVGAAGRQRARAGRPFSKVRQPPSSTRPGDGEPACAAGHRRRRSAGAAGRAPRTGRAVGRPRRGRAAYRRSALRCSHRRTRVQEPVRRHGAGFRRAPDDGGQGGAIPLATPCRPRTRTPRSSSSASRSLPAGSTPPTRASIRTSWNAPPPGSRCSCNDTGADL